MSLLLVCVGNSKIKLINTFSKIEIIAGTNYDNPEKLIHKILDITNGTWTPNLPGGAPLFHTCLCLQAREDVSSSFISLSTG